MTNAEKKDELIAIHQTLMTDLESTQSRLADIQTQLLRVAGAIDVLISLEEEDDDE